MCSSVCGLGSGSAGRMLVKLVAIVHMVRVMVMVIVMIIVVVVVVIMVVMDLQASVKMYCCVPTQSHPGA